MQGKTRNIILHIPHSSKTIPEKEKQHLLVSDQELETELLKMTDLYTDELFEFEHAQVTTLRFPISRLIVDPERFIDDQQEAMSSKGMGVIYTKTSDGKKLKEPLSTAHREYLINTYYHHHHRQLANMVHSSLKTEKQPLIIDCHSFPGFPLPYEFEQNTERPDICIGTDDYHTPKMLTDMLIGKLKEYDLEVALNSPFSGSIVPMEFYKTEPRVHSVMIEVNRSLYMDEDTGFKNERFSDIKQTLTSIIDFILLEADKN